MDQHEPARIAIDPQVGFSKRVIGGRTAYVAHSPALGRFFQLGAEEYRIATLLDGRRTVTEILATLADDGIDWDGKEVAEFVSQLVSSKLAAPVNRQHSTTNTSNKRASGGTAWTRRIPKILSLVVRQQVPLIEGQQLATKLAKRLGVLFSPAGMICWAGLVLSAMLVVAANYREFAGELKRMFDPGIWLVLLAMWVVAKIVHETGHAVAARYHDVRVGKIGIMFFFLAPLAYVDVTDAWKLRSRWSRVQIALAGVYLELAIASIAALAWWFLPDGLPRHLAAQFFLVAGSATLLVNANPLLRLDGYYVVSDLTEIPNLRMHGRKQLVAHLERILLKIEPPKPLLSGWRRKFATVHAACSVVFQVVWMGGLVLGVAVWAKGLGIVLACAAVVLWAVLPLSKWAHKVWTMQPGERWYLNPYRKRLLYFGFALVLLAQYFHANSSPFDRRVPVVVQFRDPQVARASADAFVRNVYVVRGQRVKKGMLLVELHDPELLVRRDELADDLHLAQLRAVQLRRQGDIAQSAAESENVESMRRQLAEFDGQIDGLRIVAQREGLIVSSTINNLQGSFVSRGDEVLRVSDPQEMELLVSVSESDMQAYQIAARQAQPADVRLRGGIRFAAAPAPLRPRARQTLPHPALAATAGGPLPVESSQDDGQSLQVIEPRLESRTPIDAVTSVELHAGQIGTMTIADNRSMFTRIVESLR